MLGVVRLSQLAIDLDELAGPQREAAAVDAREDLAGELSLDGVGLDQDERALDRHGRTSLLGATPASWRSHFEGREVDRRRLDRCLAVGAHLPERLERGLAVDAGLLQLRRADGTDEELVRHLRAADRAVEV